MAEKKNSESRLRAIAAYNQKNTTNVCIRLNISTDADVIEVLSQMKSKQGYIKELIRRDKAAGGGALEIEDEKDDPREDFIKVLKLTKKSANKWSKKQKAEIVNALMGLN